MTDAEALLRDLRHELAAAAAGCIDANDLLGWLADHIDAVDHVDSTAVSRPYNHAWGLVPERQRGDLTDAEFASAVSKLIAGVDGRRRA